MMAFAMLTLVFAVGPIVWVAFVPIAGWRQWLVAGAAASTASGAALVAGPWVLLSVHLRLPVAVAMVVALAFAGARASRIAPATLPRTDRRRLAWRVAASALFGLLLVDGCAGRVLPRGARSLQFPLRDGVYAVLQGGSSLATNPFHRWFPFDRYGLDLVKLTGLGNRAHALVPSDVNDYASYGVPVYSPCSGIVEAVVSDVPDNAPGHTDPRQLSGNHVLLRCEGLKVLLAHLQRGSVAVESGADVAVGQFLGRIGNSGNTSEPHLHVSAVAADSREPWQEAEGVPITFDGRFLAMNDVVRSQRRK